MEISLFSIGLAVIVLSWIVQIVYMCLRDKKMHWAFALLQALGIGVLIAYLYMNSAVRDSSFYMQILSGVGALGAFIVVLVKKK